MDETENKSTDVAPRQDDGTSAGASAAALPPATAGQQTIDAVLAASRLEPIVAGPGQYYRNTRYIMAALTIVMGFWFGYDGFVRWPAEHQKVVELTDELKTRDDPDLRTELKSHTDHSEMDIRLQRILAFSLPPLGICLLLWALYSSRGQYRLADDTLFVPGHPPVPLAAIRELDESNWDRKGIARLSYELADAQTGTSKLDDFVYERIPTDLIYDRIKAHLQPPAPEPSANPTTVDETVPADGTGPSAQP